MGCVTNDRLDGLRYMEGTDKYMHHWGPRRSALQELVAFGLYEYSVKIL